MCVGGWWVCGKEEREGMFQEILHLTEYFHSLNLNVIKYNGRYNRSINNSVPKVHFRNIFSHNLWSHCMGL